MCCNLVQIGSYFLVRVTRRDWLTYFIFIVYFYSQLANFSFWFWFLEQQDRIQSCWRRDWVWHSGDQVTYLLEHIILQDLSRYEDWRRSQVYCHKQVSRFSVLADRWWATPLHLFGSWEMEVTDWFTGLLTPLL